MSRLYLQAPVPIDISSCALFTFYPDRIMYGHPTPPQVFGTPPEQWERFGTTQEPSKNNLVILNHLHIHQGSPLIPIIRALSLILHLIFRASSLTMFNRHKCHKKINLLYEHCIGMFCQVSNIMNLNNYSNK